MPPTDPSLRVELHVRSLASGSGERQDTLSAALGALSERDTVDEYAIEVWGDAVPLDADHPVAVTISRFRDWAREAGVDLLGLEERTVGSLVDERRVILSLPTVALAEYRDGDLAVVTPHRRPDGTICRVDDRLDAIADGTAIPTVPPADASKTDDVDPPLP